MDSADLTIGLCLVKIYQDMDANWKFGEQERSIRVAWGKLKSISNLQSALQTSQLHPYLDICAEHEPIVLYHRWIRVCMKKEIYYNCVGFTRVHWSGPLSNWCLHFCKRKRTFTFKRFQWKSHSMDSKKTFQFIWNKLRHINFMVYCHWCLSNCWQI